MTEKLYKVLGHKGAPFHGGAGAWHLNGKWMPKIKDIEPCQRGYHLCRRQDLIHWLGPEIWEAKFRGERIDCTDKVVVSEARLVRKCRNWDVRTTWLFAADCAEHVLCFFEKRYPNDDRPRMAIKMARQFADRKISAAAAAAADAAYAYDPSAAAAYSADYASNAAYAAAYASVAAAACAYNAAYSNAYAAASAAAYSAAAAAHAHARHYGDAANAYNAAYFNAHSAAASAASAASAYAYASAAYAADADDAAAKDERRWQTERLFQYLENEV